MVDSFAKAYKMYNTESETMNVSHGLSVIMMLWSIDCNKYTTWCRMSVVGEDVGEWGQGIYGNSLYFPL